LDFQYYLRLELITIRIKKGCSLNGSNEFLMEIGFLQCNLDPFHYLRFKRIVVNFQDGKIFDQSQELDKTMLNFKKFIGIVRSTIPIVGEERSLFSQQFSI